jgi:hypothetical protein
LSVVLSILQAPLPLTLSHLQLPLSVVLSILQAPLPLTLSLLQPPLYDAKYLLRLPPYLSHCLSLSAAICHNIFSSACLSVVLLGPEIA